jgi:hypothetical protein
MVAWDVGAGAVAQGALDVLNKLFRGNDRDMPNHGKSVVNPRQLLGDGVWEEALATAVRGRGAETAEVHPSFDGDKA